MSSSCVSWTPMSRKDLRKLVGSASCCIVFTHRRFAPNLSPPVGSLSVVKEGSNDADGRRDGQRPPGGGGVFASDQCGGSGLLLGPGRARSRNGRARRRLG